MDTNQNSADSRETGGLDLSIFWRIFKRRWIFVVIAAIVVGLGAGAYASAHYVPQYAASVSFLMKVDAGNANQYQYANINDSIVSTYEVAFKYNREFCQSINELAGTDALGYTADDVAAMMSCEQILPNTPTLKVTFTCPNPRAASNLATALEMLANRELEEQFSETLDAVDIFNKPEEPTVPATRNPFVRMFVMGFAIGAILMYALFLLLALTDNRIHGESSMEDFSEYPILGVVPALSGKRGSGSSGRSVNSSVDR